MSQTGKQISVWCGGSVTAELKVWLEGRARSKITLHFVDEALPYDEQVFLSFHCPAFLLEEVGAGSSYKLMSEHGVCVLASNGGTMLTLLHQRQDFPFANTWQVDRLEFCLALQALNWAA